MSTSMNKKQVRFTTEYLPPVLEMGGRPPTLPVPHPMPCSDLELSMLDSSTVMDRLPGKEIRIGKEMERKMLENDSPYMMPPTSGQLTNKRLLRVMISNNCGIKLPTLGTTCVSYNNRYGHRECNNNNKNGETLRHILSGCSVLAGNEYLERHNQVAKILHQKIALKYKLIDNELPYYQYKQLSVLENSAAKLYWDRPILTDRTIPANRPDIVLVDHSKNTTYIVDVTIPHDENLQKAERDKILKYMDLAHEIKDIWRTPATIVVPIVISTNGLIPKSLHANLSKVGVDGGLKYLMQKAVLLSTCRTLPLIASAAQSKKQFYYTPKYDNDSTLSFFTKPLDGSDGDGGYFLKEKSLLPLKNSIVDSTPLRQTQIQNHSRSILCENQTQNVFQKNRGKSVNHHNYKDITDNDLRASCGQCSRDERCCNRRRNENLCPGVTRNSQECCRDCRYRQVSETQNSCNCVNRNKINKRNVTKDYCLRADPVEAKRKAIERKYKLDDVNTIVENKQKVNDEEPTVSDLCKIIQMQSEQLQILQQRFEKFLSVNEKEKLKNDTQFRRNVYNDVNCVEHISIGVMTSFEMVMSSNKSVNSDKKLIDECVQTSYTQNTLKGTPKNAMVDQFRNGFDPQIPSERIFRNDDANNFLDGIARVNNGPPSQKYVESKALDIIDEENHETPMRVSPRGISDSDGQRNINDNCDDPQRQGNENGWTFYNDVVNRVNNLLNSPPDGEDTRRQTRQQLSPRRGDNREITPQQNRGITNTPQRQITRVPAHPVFTGMEKPVSELSLHMRQLASKYNIQAPMNINRRDGTSPNYGQPVDPMGHCGQIPRDQYTDDDYKLKHNIFNDKTNERIVLQNRHADQNVFDNNYFGGHVFGADVQHPQMIQHLMMGEAKENLYHGVATDMSFGTLQYMKRYKLMTVTNERPSPIGLTPAPVRPLPPPYKNPSRILDITTLKQQPKLL